MLPVRPRRGKVIAMMTEEDWKKEDEKFRQSIRDLFGGDPLLDQVADDMIRLYDKDDSWGTDQHSDQR